MRRIETPFLLATLAILSTGCGGGSPSPASPSPVTAQPTPAPTPHPVLTILGGDTDRPVAGARVVVAGVASTTDASGRVSLNGAPAGATIDIIAEGYLDRQTQVRVGSENLARFTLWPRRPLSRFDESYTQQLVYTSSTIGSEGTTNPLRRLSKGTTQIRVVLPPELSADATSAFFHQFAADNMNTAVQGVFRYTVGSTSVSGSLNVPVSVNPGAPNCTDGRYAAYASVATTSTAEISSISITYCSLRWARDGRVILHEMGHTLGLRHSLVGSDVMFSGSNNDVFSDRELLVMKLMYQRPSGNAFPDNDRATVGLSSERLDTLLCAH